MKKQMISTAVISFVILLLSGGVYYYTHIRILFTIWFGSLEVFIITSCLSALFDSIFVIMQRFNRPRLMRLVKK